MSAFQITFRGVLPDDDLRELAEAMHAKVQARYGKSARCHVAIEQSGALSSHGGVTARVQLESDTTSIKSHAQSLHQNPVRAVRTAFDQAYLQIQEQARAHGAAAQTRASTSQAGVLLLFAARRQKGVQRAPLRVVRTTQESTAQASRNEYLSALSTRTRG